MSRFVTLTVTLAVAVALSVSLWRLNVVAFNTETFAFHIISIYIGVAAVLLLQAIKRRR